MTITPKRFQSPPPRIERADVPLSTLAADLKRLVARQRACQLLADAADHSNSPSDRIAYALDAWLITHPEAPVSTLADYPNWTPGGTS
jgi:hypothetical protein